jgi:TPR repeat protein
MSQGGSSKQPCPSGPSYTASILVALIGLIVGLAVQEWRWRHTASMSQSTPAGQSLQVAEKAFRAGDKQDAIAIFRKLADHNNPDAQYWLGHMTELGLGVPRDIGRAIDLYKKSASQNVVAAEVRLGELYLHGDQTPPDFAQAKTYLEKAANVGDARAAMLLGQVYRLGLGVPENATEAYAWLEVSSIEGNQVARHERDALLHGMSGADQTTAVAKAQDHLRGIKQQTTPPKNVPPAK